MEGLPSQIDGPNTVSMHELHVSQVHNMMLAV